MSDLQKWDDMSDDEIRVLGANIKPSIPKPRDGLSFSRRNIRCDDSPDYGERKYREYSEKNYKQNDEFNSKNRISHWFSWQSVIIFITFVTSCILAYCLGFSRGEIDKMVTHKKAKTLSHSSVSKGDYAITKEKNIAFADAKKMQK